MSGGSFNYLCSRDAEGLLDGSHDEDLQQMAEELRGRPDGKVAADETQALLDYLQRVRARVAVKLTALSPVWKAVEWRRSGDWGEDAVTESLKVYHEGERR